jgi:hypothetical protein
VHLGAIIGQGVTKTAGLEKFVRHFQVDHTVASGIVGCAHLNIFGEREYIRKLPKKKRWSFSALDEYDLGERQTLLPVYENEASDFDYRQMLHGKHTYF